MCRRYVRPPAENEWPFAQADLPISVRGGLYSSSLCVGPRADLVIISLSVVSKSNDTIGGVKYHFCFLLFLYAFYFILN